MPGILLTTVCREPALYDYFRENSPENFRWRLRMPRRISFGLRFLRQNIPELEILEYPTRAEFSETIKTGEWYTLVDDFRTFPIGQMVSEIPLLNQVAWPEVGFPAHSGSP